MSVTTQSEIMNYDPNMTLCGHLAKQTVLLTFGQWHYRQTYEVVVGGNLTGLDVITCAVESLYASLPYDYFVDDEGQKQAIATIVIGELECSDEECLGEQWLGEMLVAAQIISIEPAGVIA